MTGKLAWGQAYTRPIRTAGSEAACEIEQDRHSASNCAKSPASIFDFVQGITRVARDKPHQDARLDLEGRAKKLLDFAG